MHKSERGAESLSGANGLAVSLPFRSAGDLLYVLGVGSILNLGAEYGIALLAGLQHYDGLLGQYLPATCKVMQGKRNRHIDEAQKKAISEVVI